MTKKSDFDVDVGKLFDEGFPDFKYLRCGNETFYIFSDIREKILSDVKEKISRDFSPKKDTLEKIDIKN